MIAAYEATGGGLWRLVAGLLIAAAAPVVAQPVNETLAGSQHEADVCRLAGGGYAVVWQSDQNEGPGTYDIYARRLDAAAQPVGPEFLVNLTTAGNQQYPDVCCDPAGGFAVAWQSPGPAPDGDEIMMARRFPAGGAPGPELTVNVASTSQVNDMPAVCCPPNGDLLVAWTDRSGLDGDRGGIFLRRFVGTTGGPEVQANQEGTDIQESPHLCCSAGGLGVLWADRPDLGSVSSLELRRFATEGSPLTGDLDVATDGRGELCCDPAGGVRVVWDDGETLRHLRSRAFAPDGTPAGGELVVEETADVPNHVGTGQGLIPVLPRICCPQDRDDFVVAWTELDYRTLDADFRASAHGFVAAVPLATTFREAGVTITDGLACTDEPTSALLTWQTQSAEIGPPTFGRDVFARIVNLVSSLEVPTLGSAALALLALLLALAAGARLRRQR